MPKSPTVDRFKRNAARRLRENSTGAESLLWRNLKQLEIRGTHFRRQMPLGRFIVDFACPAAKLIIEVDGSQHGSVEGHACDDARTQWLNGEGYRVLRFWNNDITRNIEGVIEQIYAALYGATNAEPKTLRHRRSRGVVKRG